MSDEWRLAPQAIEAAHALKQIATCRRPRLFYLEDGGARSKAAPDTIMVSLLIESDGARSRRSRS